MIHLHKLLSKPCRRLRAILFVLSIGLLLLAGCAKRGHYVTSDGVEVDWKRAMDLFERERYNRAQQAFRDITLNYSGSAIIDSAYFYLGLTSYELNDYLVAADEFHRVITRFPSSALAGDAAYYEARSYFELAPPYTLDQQFMTKSFGAFQRFLEDYPEHSLSDSAYVYMARAREQLAKKEYRAAELYYQLGEYASAILYADALLSDYYDTRQAAHAQFLKARSYYRLKDWTRAREEFDNYIRRFPDANHVPRAKDLRTTSAERESLVTTQAVSE